MAHLSWAGLNLAESMEARPGPEGGRSTRGGAAGAQAVRQRADLQTWQRSSWWSQRQGPRKEAQVLDSVLSPKTERCCWPLSYLQRVWLARQHSGCSEGLGPRSPSGGRGPSRINERGGEVVGGMGEAERQAHGRRLRRARAGTPLLDLHLLQGAFLRLLFLT